MKESEERRLALTMQKIAKQCRYNIFSRSDKKKTLLELAKFKKNVNKKNVKNMLENASFKKRG